MTIHELIERLEEYREEIGGDAEVRLMTQSNWPFEYGIAGMASRAEINETAADGSGEDVDDIEDDGVLFIVEGQQICYGAKEAWDVAR
jgi:hypothetical protein